MFADIDVDLNYAPQLQQLDNYEKRSLYFNVEQFNNFCCEGLDLKVIHFNIRSLGCNMEDLCALLSQLRWNFDAICITESWLSDHTEPLCSIHGYQSFIATRRFAWREY